MKLFMYSVSRGISGHAAGKYRALQKPMESFNKGVDPDELAAEMKNCLEEKRD